MLQADDETFLDCLRSETVEPFHCGDARAAQDLP